MTPRALTKFLGPIRRSINLMVGRAVVSLVNDALKMQGVQVQLLADEVRDNVERFQNYGFTSHPHPEAEAIVVSIGGNRNHAVVIAVDDRRYRLKGLAAGEVALYTDEGDKIVLKRGGIIEVTAATKTRIVAPLVEMTGELNVTGKITGLGGMAISGGAGSTFGGGTLTHDGVNIGKTHVHGGVTVGGANTGVPQ